MKGPVSKSCCATKKKDVAPIINLFAHRKKSQTQRDTSQTARTETNCPKPMLIPRNIEIHHQFPHLGPHFKPNVPPLILSIPCIGVLDWVSRFHRSRIKSTFHMLFEINHGNPRPTQRVTPPRRCTWPSPPPKPCGSWATLTATSCSSRSRPTRRRPPPAPAGRNPGKKW